MNHIARSLPAALALFLAGCPSVPEPAGGPTFRESGAFVEHVSSGMQFPRTLGVFSRTGVHQYDATGLDVSAGYNAADPAPVTITVYVYPSPRVVSLGSPDNVIADARRNLAQGAYRQVKGEILQLHRDVATLSEREITTLVSGGSHFGYAGTFAYTEYYAGAVRPLHSLAFVYCYVGGKWTVAYRITYPADSGAELVVDRFLSDLKWTIQP